MMEIADSAPLPESFNVRERSVLPDGQQDPREEALLGKSSGHASNAVHQSSDGTIVNVWKEFAKWEDAGDGSVVTDGTMIRFTKGQEVVERIFRRAFLAWGGRGEASEPYIFIVYQSRAQQSGLVDLRQRQFSWTFLKGQTGAVKVTRAEGEVLPMNDEAIKSMRSSVPATYDAARVRASMHEHTHTHTHTRTHTLFLPCCRER